jgi:hypothetical protein
MAFYFYFLLPPPLELDEREELDECEIDRLPDDLEKLWLCDMVEPLLTEEELKDGLLTDLLPEEICEEGLLLTEEERLLDREE